MTEMTKNSKTALRGGVKSGIKRFFATLLSAAAAIFSLCANAATDELGETPQHWYRFTGTSVKSLGESTLTWTASPSVYTADPQFGGKCAAGPGTKHGGYGRGLSFGSGSWTIVVRGRMNSEQGSILLCLGDTMSQTSVSITSEGAGVVGLSPCSGDKERGVIGTYSLADTSTAFHTYILQKTGSGASTSLKLYIDGTLAISGTRDMSNSTYQNFTFFGLMGNDAGNTTYKVATTSMTSAISDFRLYRRVLTAEEMKTLANAPTDEIGLRPAAWFALDGSLDGEAAGFLPSVALSASGAAYAEGRDGRGKALTSPLTGEGLPFGATTGTAGGDWTVLLDMKAAETADNAVYFGTGDGTTSACFALTSAGENKFQISAYGGSDVHADKLGAVATVDDASSTFHRYAIVRSGQYIKLFIDGVEKGTVDRNNNPQKAGTGTVESFTLLKSPGGAGANGGFVDAEQSAISDFRFYRKALSAAELQAIGAAARDELEGTPVHWYRFGGSLASSGRKALAMDGEYASSAYDGETGALLPSGDKPAGTGVALRAHTWSIVVKGRTDDAAKAVLASFGTSLESGTSGLALVSGGEDVVKLCGFGSGLAAGDLVSATVENASSETHTYAIVREGNNVSLWVDAIAAGTVSRPSDPSVDTFALFGVHDGLGATGFATPGEGAQIADLRVYDRALTAHDQAVIAGMDALMTEAYWTGRGESRLVTDPGNWRCLNAIGEEMEGVVPAATANVYFSGEIAPLAPAGAVLEGDSFTFDCTLAADCDWSALAGKRLSGTIDLAGFQLTLAGLDGDGTVTDTAGGGTLRLDAGSANVTVGGDSVELAGSLKLVKAGSGAYIAGRANSYTGGTIVENGTAKFGTAGSNLPFGAQGTAITVPSGGRLDANGQTNLYFNPVVLSGGTLANTGADHRLDADFGFGDITLATDSSIAYSASLSLYAPAKTTLDLGGFTLSATASAAKPLRLCNCDVTAGTLALGGNANSTLVFKEIGDASQASFSTVRFAPYCASEVKDLTITGVCEYQTQTDYATSVNGTFAPGTTQFQNIEMLDGSTLILPALEGTFDTANSEHADRNITFAAGANVTIDVSKRTDLRSIAEQKDATGAHCGLLLSWTAKPDNVAFSLTGTAKRYKLKQTDAGLLIAPPVGLTIIVR